MQEENILERIAQSSLASLPGNRIGEQSVPWYANSHNYCIIPARELIVKLSSTTSTLVTLLISVLKRVSDITLTGVNILVVSAHHSGRGRAVLIPAQS